jgi:hypothetical protein
MQWKEVVTSGDDNVQGQRLRKSDAAQCVCTQSVQFANPDCGPQAGSREGMTPKISGDSQQFQTVAVTKCGYIIENNVAYLGGDVGKWATGGDLPLTDCKLAIAAPSTG